MWYYSHDSIDNDLSAPLLAPHANPNAPPITPPPLSCDSDRRQRKTMTIVHISPELSPFIWGGLGLSLSGLAASQRALGHRVFVILPYLRSGMDLQGLVPQVVLPNLQIRLPTGEMHPMVVLKVTWTTTQGGDIPIFFVHHSTLNDQDIYSYSNNMCTMTLLLSLAQLEVVKQLIANKNVDENDNGVQVMHFHDWSTGLGVFEMKQDPYFSRTCAVFTCHNFAYKGLLPVEDGLRRGLSSLLFNADIVVDNAISQLRIGLVYADKITTVSPTYCNESLVSEGYGEEPLLQRRAKAGDYIGILNGTCRSWDPETDAMIPENYTAVTAFDTKKRNKLSFQRSLGLMEDASIPLVGICARITEQKGIQFLIPSIEILLAKNCQLVVVGNASKDDQFGQSILQSLLKVQSNFPHAVAIKPFAEEFERRLISAADIFYMCSIYEPAGIAQQHAGRYGAVVVGTPVGGILDTVIDYREDPTRGNGMLCDGVNQACVEKTLLHVIELYQSDKRQWEIIMRNAMLRDCSWESVVEKHLRVYTEALLKVDDCLHVYLDMPPMQSCESNSVSFQEDLKNPSHNDVVPTAAVDKVKSVTSFIVALLGCRLDYMMWWNIRVVLLSQYTPPGRDEYFYLLFKASFINLAVRSYLILNSFFKGEVPLYMACLSLVWYQMQDCLFTLHGQTYMRFLAKINESVKIFHLNCGDLIFVMNMLFVLELSNRLLLGPVGNNPPAYTLKGIALIWLNMVQGMVSAGPIDPAVNKLKESGLISHAAAMHLYQLLGFTLLFGLLGTFGYQKLHAVITTAQLIISFTVYIFFTIFPRPKSMVKHFYRTIKAAICSTFCSSCYPDRFDTGPAPKSISEVDWDSLSLGPFTPSPASWNDHVLYSIIVDRFNVSYNDLVPSVPPPILFRHGGTIKGVIKQLNYLNDLGVTTLLLCPVQVNVQHVLDSEPYHGYAAYNMMDVDPHLGSMGELCRLVEEAHELGMAVVLDFTVNHLGPVFEYLDEKGIFESLATGPQAVCWKYQVVPSELNKEEHFSRLGVCQNMEDPIENMNGDFPPNNRRLSTNRKETQDVLLQILKYWILRTDIDGFRLDAVKHVHPSFVSRMATELRTFTAGIGKRNFLLLGEILSSVDSDLLPFMLPTSIASTYNYPGYRRMNCALHGQSPTRDLEISFCATLAAFGPQAQEYISNMVSFLDNHDVYRFLRHGESLGTLHAALGYLLFSVGIPMLYYGTEQEFRQSSQNLGAEHSEDPADPENRQSMFQPCFIHNEGEKPEVYQPFSKRSSTWRLIRRLLQVRKVLPELRRGSQIIRFSDPKGPGVFAFSRIYKQQEALVVINTDNSPKSEVVVVGDTLGVAGMEVRDVLDQDYVVSITYKPPTCIVLVEVGPKGLRILLPSSHEVFLDRMGSENTTCDHSVCLV